MVFLSRLGSSVVRLASGTEIEDTTSGFRAYNREAALQVQVVSSFTYTLTFAGFTGPFITITGP